MYLYMLSVYIRELIPEGEGKSGGYTETRSVEVYIYM